ncbi:hypothetical protein [Cupriavidus sp. SW-Y-13]|uniref:hypothetical protein n=1 Tax=Cupriavidus sp. SW-Y-13 TaxID=2653854 RepID=UPI00136622B2|nr:hypothetical protein [Cupriavidus sp. SW-Y-13]MWL87150.1 hypothetical protein [Cupriavidus sp. SW-Y-13]
MAYYTLQDYDAAKSNLEQLRQRSDNYDGNNPNKFRAPIADATERLYIIEREMKLSGQLPATEVEKLGFELDKLFPDARHGQVVELNEKKYKRRATPGAYSLAGNPKFWILSWDHLDSD